MKKFLLTAFLFGLILMQSQLCVEASGLFYTNSNYPVTATGAKVENLDNLKKGTASTTNILYLVETGDASINAAARNGGIKKISHIDIAEKSVFIFYRKVKVIVYGE